jgi:hypothetical protein
MKAKFLSVSNYLGLQYPNSLSSVTMSPLYANQIVQNLLQLWHAYCWFTQLTRITASASQQGQYDGTTAMRLCFDHLTCWLLQRGSRRSVSDNTRVTVESPECGRTVCWWPGPCNLITPSSALAAITSASDSLAAWTRSAALFFINYMPSERKLISTIPRVFL